MSEDPRDARLQARLNALESAIADIEAEACAAAHALCAHELQMRLENIARRVEALRAAQPRGAGDGTA
ncbi:hypothetical protein GAY33_30190 [Azospirillum brasilense]|uniref:Uncharacterized protein n=1 Tax=Azospirillum argentinense TaxID=2970906 RepID=A0A5B0KPH7_9PROT|nr:hypothetical protein [Azospirillum argentinense]KAA1054587.1 hypothetical protein FH063_006422 [Azospirillum argentinense]MBK3803407.1 hypothetical protein [Azospirillum argentinense]